MRLSYLLFVIFFMPAALVAQNFHPVKVAGKRPHCPSRMARFTVNAMSVGGNDDEARYRPTDFRTNLELTLDTTLYSTLESGIQNGGALYLSGLDDLGGILRAAKVPPAKLSNLLDHVLNLVSGRFEHPILNSASRYLTSPIVATKLLVGVLADGASFGNNSAAFFLRAPRRANHFYWDRSLFGRAFPKSDSEARTRLAEVANHFSYDALDYNPKDDYAILVVDPNAVSVLNDEDPLSGVLTPKMTITHEFLHAADSYFDDVWVGANMFLMTKNQAPDRIFRHFALNIGGGFWAIDVAMSHLYHETRAYEITAAQIMEENPGRFNFDGILAAYNQLVMLDNISKSGNSALQFLGYPTELMEMLTTPKNLFRDPQGPNAVRAEMEATIVRAEAAGFQPADVLPQLGVMDILKMMGKRN